jgi:hypothetical protein
MDINHHIKAMINFIPNYIDDTVSELKCDINQQIGSNVVEVFPLDVNDDGSVKSLLQGQSHEVYQYLIEAGYASSTEDADSRLIIS